jgi:hypothetical protein
MCIRAKIFEERAKGVKVADAEDALAFLSHVRALCEKYQMTLVPGDGRVFHLGRMRNSLKRLEAQKIGSILHISPHWAELDSGDGIVKVIK